MSYSGRSSSGGAAGVAGVFGTILLVVLGVGLKVAARAMRNSNRHSHDTSYHNSPPGNLPLSREDARQTSIVPSPAPIPAPSNDDWLAEQQRLQREQAEQAARQQREWQQQQEANRLQQAQQAEADRQRRESELALQEQQRAAERQAEQEQRDRDRAALEAARNPPPIQPADPQPTAQQPVAQQPGAPAGNPDVPPGMAVTNLDQVKPKTEVFARGDDGWHPAVVTRRVGADVTVRLTTNGAVGRVSLDRIRLKDDPDSVSANDGRPGALRPVTAQRDPANKPVPEDDALIVVKPRKDPEEAAEQPAVAAPAGPPTKSGTAPIVRTWTNDTGEFKVAAELVGFEFDLVQLKKADGKVISIRIEKLSADDQAFVRARFP